MKNRRFDAVLFDLDGTLLYTLPDIHGAVNAALARCGYEARTPEQTRRAVGNGSRKLIERSLPEGTAPEEVTRVLEVYRAYYNAHLMDGTVPYPGVEATVAALGEAGVRMGVVTNKFHDSAAALMDRFFPGRMETVEGNRADRPTKPAPDAVWAALEVLGVPRDRALYVGDSGVDAATAANAGLACALVSWGYWDRTALAERQPLALLDRPEALTALVLGRETRQG